MIAVAHGSRDPEAAQATEALVAAIRRRLPDVDVTLAYLDFESPSYEEARGALPHAAVVPLLLSRGTHSSRDLPPEAAPPLGPDDHLTRALLDRARESGIAPGTPLVLGAAGTLDADGREDVRAQGRLVQQAWGAPVSVGFVTAASPTVAEARATMLDEHGSVAVLSYFLAPGRLPSASRAVSAPLRDHPEVVELVALRYEERVRTLSSATSDAPHAAIAATTRPG